MVEATDAIATFAIYIQSLDCDLTEADATAIAAFIVCGLPNWFEQNPNLKDLLIEEINHLKEEKA